MFSFVQKANPAQYLVVLSGCREVDLDKNTFGNRDLIICYLYIRCSLS